MRRNLLEEGLDTDRGRNGGLVEKGDHVETFMLRKVVDQPMLLMTVLFELDRRKARPIPSLT